MSMHSFLTLRDMADKPETMKGMTCNCGAYINSLSDIATRFCALPLVRSITLSRLLIEQFGDEKYGWLPSNYKESLHIEKNDWWTDCDYNITNMMLKSTNGFDYDQVGLMNICKNNPSYYRFAVDLTDDW